MLPAAATQLPLAAPGLAGARKPPSQSAGIYTVAGVAGGDPSLGGYPSTEAWDEIHGGAIGTMQVLKCTATSDLCSCLAQVFAALS